MAPALAGIARVARITGSAGGQRGVEKALANMHSEVERDMKLMGITRLGQLSRDMLRYRQRQS